MVHEVGKPAITVDNNSTQMEGDSKSLHLELEGARSALRIQSTRCRQIVAAFTRKLEEKEIETRNSSILRDQQLSQVVRALLVLEARLRREQRSIRCLLGERDAVIRSQQLEIARLKKALNTDSDTSTSTEPVHDTIIRISSPAENKNECDVKPDLISSLCITEFNTRKENADDDALSNMDSIQLSLYEFESQPNSLLSDLSTQSCNGDALEMFELNSNVNHQAIGTTQMNRSHESSSKNLNRNITKHDVINITNPMSYVDIRHSTRDRYEEKYSMLTPVKEESMNLSLSPWNRDHVNNNVQNEVVIHKPETEQKKKEAKPSPSTLLQEVRIGSNKNEYEDNPVLNCVNQILLRDQEEFLEEQRALRLKEQERNKVELKPQSQDGNVYNNTSKEKHLLPPRKLTFEDTDVLRKLPNKIEHGDTNNIHERKEDTNKETQNLGNKNIQNKSVIPPALPPKPNRLISKHLDNRLVLDAIQHKYLPQSNRIDMKQIEIINKRTSLPNPSTDNELYVISNSAIDDVLLQQLQGRKTKISSKLDIGLNSNRTRPLNIRSRDGLYTAGNHNIPHPTHKPQEKLSNDINNYMHVELDTPKKGHNGKEDSGKKICQQQSPTKKTSSPSTIKVASPVSSLIATVDSITHDESRKDTSPSVSQIVRRFEDLGSRKETATESGDDTLSKNFEEFRLDDCDMEALCGGLEDGNSQIKDEGAEQRLKEAAAALEAKVSYENFLEATGLSQKSIMTPSRMFSNHKSVMKPKDVKHRNRVKAAAVIERFSHPQTLSNSTVRYWTEPFL